MRFVTVIAALDTGSSFEGMGASREVVFSALAEPTLLLGLASVAHETRSLSLSLMVPAGLATLLIGLFLIVSRRTAVTQVLGYIVVENGIYTFGVALVGGVPMLVELGVLMDVFVAVFIMSIAAYHISREFDHIDVDQLDKLKG